MDTWLGISFRIIILAVFFDGTISRAAGSMDEAFYIEPMEVQMAPARQTATIKVVNNEEHMLRIRVDVFERTDSIDGSERRVLSRDLRPDAVEFDMAPGALRHITLSYRGAKEISRERAFRVVVKQVESAQMAATDSLDLRFIYIASVFVTPEKARAKLVVDAVRRIADRSVELEISNAGQAHQKMKQIRTIVFKQEPGVRSAPRELELSAGSIEMLSKTNLLSGARRIFKLELNENEDGMSSEARLRVNLETAKDSRPPASN